MKSVAVYTNKNHSFLSSPLAGEGRVRGEMERDFIYVNSNNKLKTALDKLYLRYNKRAFVSPDPLQFLYDYKNTADREIVGLIASSLAYGNVNQIIKAVDVVLSKLGKHPKKFILNAETKKLKTMFKDFKYRFTISDEIVNLLKAVRIILLKHGSLNKLFIEGLNKKDETVINALKNFAAEIIAAGGKMPSLIPSPKAKSGFKRLNLFLRWMIRKDGVDVGGWSGIKKSQLIIPLDTHMQKIAQNICFTKRKGADMNTALEITYNFRKICPSDPVKYDFALTRFGIRDELNLKKLAKCLNK